MALRLLLTLVLALAVGCSTPPDPPKTHKPALKVVNERKTQRGVALTLSSPSLETETLAEVLLPAGWKPGTTWPVLYLLEGCCHESTIDWTARGRASELTEDLPVIVVALEGGHAGFYSDWADGPQWESFHVKELIPYLESTYGGNGRRAIAGFSMGGLGAFSYAARHPGMFRAAASFSGLLDAGRADADYLARDKSHDLWRDEDIPKHSPTSLIAELTGIPLYVACGNGEPGPLDSPSTPKDDGEATIEEQNRRFVAAAEKAGAKVTVSLYGPGTHAWPYWTRELERALPLLTGPLR
ncbi:MAG: esterase family protein [Thermoactinospora sp.]|nr:esterase family protein [Thermoactinospora sp.]